MDLFLDCEWADVLASELVSIALISRDGQYAFYAERDPLPANPTQWVRSVVYPLLDRGDVAMNDATMTLSIRQFLVFLDNPRIHYDFGADRSLCQFVIDGFDIPEPPGPMPPSINWHLCQNLEQAVEAWWSSHPDVIAGRHHALMDARALRSAYINSLDCGQVDR
ncbi:hypothetical protein DVT68_00260 [Dyella solisilvae]|uniref:Uncharacterized protein n=1 Tax=Dyella solisilvae TaxID=1920168 RepID=A0A370K9N7_9GAMM|nr:3'-5' exoribonuclease [Dyella solisilvae]RDI99335.1 hypothetical protein DVT68_00260 [Dyella solisilvae]